MALIMCPNCKNEISETEQVCPYCGSSLEHGQIVTRKMVETSEPSEAP